MIHSYEEHGHHEWIINDLNNLGVNTKKIIHGKPNSATSGLIGFMYYTAGYFNPLGTLGDSFIIEGLSQLFATMISNSLENTGLPENTLTYLSRHGEADQAHMEDLKNLINKFVTKEEDLNDMIYVANMEYEMYGDVISSAIKNLLVGI